MSGGFCQGKAVEWKQIGCNLWVTATKTSCYFHVNIMYTVTLYVTVFDQYLLSTAEVLTHFHCRHTFSINLFSDKFTQMSY